jgi:hypothetical protein
MFIAVSGIVFFSLLYLFRCVKSVRIVCGIPANCSPQWRFASQNSDAGTCVLLLDRGYYGAPTDSRFIAEIYPPPPKLSDKTGKRFPP